MEMLDRLEKRYDGVSSEIVVNTGLVPLSRVWREIKQDLMGKEVQIPGLKQLLFEYRTVEELVFDWHSHPEKEIILIREGEISYKKKINGEVLSFFATSGETIVFKPNESHWLRIAPDTFFSQSFIPKPTKQQTPHVNGKP